MYVYFTVCLNLKQLIILIHVTCCSLHRSSAKTYKLIYKLQVQLQLQESVSK